MSGGPLEHDDEGRHQVAIGNHLGGRQPRRRVLDQEEAHRRRPDGEVEHHPPDQRRQVHPVGREDLGRPVEDQPDRRRQHRPEAQHQRRLAAVEAAQQRRVDRVGDAADEVDEFALADIEAQQRIEITPEDHPDRAHPRQQQADQHCQPRALPDDEIGGHRRHQRHQRIDGAGRHRLRHGQRDEHGDEVDRREEPVDRKAPGRRREGEFLPRERSAAR